MSKRKSDAKDKSGYVKIELELPAAVVKFLEDVNAFAGAQFDIKEYIQERVLDCFQADLKSCEDSPFWDTQTLIEKYGLDKLLEDC